MKTTLITQWAISPPWGDLYLISSSLFPLDRVWLFFQMLDQGRMLAWPMACLTMSWWEGLVRTLSAA